MAVKSVQVSLPEDLVAQVDARPETQQRGRSAVVQRALRLYLELARKEETDRAYDRAYGRSEISDELAPLMEGQLWPEK